MNSGWSQLISVATVASATLFLAACAKPLPRYPAMAPTEAIRIMRDRDSEVRSISVECNVEIRGKGPEDSSVSLDAVLVAQWPDHLRVRAWKFGHPAFDLTSTPDGVWLYVTEEAKERAGAQGELSVNSEQFRRVWGLLGPDFLRDDSLTSREEREKLILIRPLNPGGTATVQCIVDPETLTAEQYRFMDENGRVRQTLTLSLYRLSLPGQILWPRMIIAEGDSGSITIRMREPEFNGEIATGAFVPPKRAVKQP